MNILKETWIVSVDDTNFERDVVQASQAHPVVVDFWAPWCGISIASAQSFVDISWDLDQSKVLFFSVNTNDIGGPIEVAQELAITHVNFYSNFHGVIYSHGAK